MDIDLVGFLYCSPLLNFGADFSRSIINISSFMTSPSFSNSDARVPFNISSTSSARTTRNPPVAPHPGPRFADFQFRTIGQQPELLKRISAPNPDTQCDNDDNDPGRLSSPPLSTDQSIQALPLPESGAKRPSLWDRLSLLESSVSERDNAVDVTMASTLEIGVAVDPRPTQSIGVLPMATSTTQARICHPDSSFSVVSPAVSRMASIQNDRLGEELDLSQSMIYTDKQAIKPTERGDTSASNKKFSDISPSSETQAQLSPSFVQTSTQANGISGIPTSFLSGEDVYSLVALRTLQSRLSSLLVNFNPISTASALAAAQSAKDQCTEVLATAHRAHTLAQQASLLAQDSVVASQECLNVAATIQNRADLALSAIEKVRSGQGIGSGGEGDYNATLRALKDDLYQLAEWVRLRDAYESRPLEEDQIEKKKLDLRLECELNKFSTDKQSHGLNAQLKSSAVPIIHVAGAMTVEDEADAATRAWNQHRQQRKRLAEDEPRKRREAEAELERQRLQAQSEADAREAELEELRAERLKAEEEERSRQEKESLELQRRRQGLEIVRFLQSQKQAQDDLAKVAAEEKRKAHAAEAKKEARLIAEQEQKRREIREKEILKRQEIEKAKALLAESEAKRREKLERLKRLAAEARQLPVSTDSIANILDKAQEKQSMATLTTGNHTPSQHVPLPSTHQAPAPSSPNHARFSNVVLNETLLHSPRTSMQQDRTLSGSVRVDEHPNSVNLTSISSIPKSTTSLQKNAKSHEVTSNIPSSIDKPILSDNSTPEMSSNHIRKVDRQSSDVAGPLKSLSPLVTLSEGNSLLPVNMPPVHIPISPTTNLTDFEDIHAERSDGSDAGNLFVVPPSRVLPVSAEAQRANLRPFMDANGISYGPGASDIDKQKPISSSADQPSATCCKPLSSSQVNGDQICRTSSASKLGSQKKPKLEPLDVPALSIPSPPVASISVVPTCVALPAKPKSKIPDFKKIEGVSPMGDLETSSSSKELPTSPQTMPTPGSFGQSPQPTATQSDVSSLANPSIVCKEKVRPAAVRRNVPPLASKEQAPTFADAINEAFQANDQHHSVSPRMGPDAAVTDGWAQHVATVDDVMTKGPQKQARRQGLDAFSPPVNSQHRMPLKRPRVPHPRTNDHYSPPRRIPDSLPSSHNDHPGDRRPSGLEHARGFSEGTSLSPEDVATIGRKRYRDGDPVDAPPPRRHRYDSSPFRRDDYAQPPASSHQQPDVDWNRMPIYGRSPSPEPRLTPLALRLESEKSSWNSRGGSSYRPIYNNSNSYAYDPHSRNNKNLRYLAPPSQSVPQGSSYYSDASVPFNQQRQFVRDDVTNETHLPLLSRFTDSAEHTIPPFNNHHGPTRPRSIRGPRGGGNHALEQRISKPKSVSLINRLEDAN